MRSDLLRPSHDDDEIMAVVMKHWANCMQLRQQGCNNQMVELMDERTFEKEIGWQQIVLDRKQNVNSDSVVKKKNSLIIMRRKLFKKNNIERRSEMRRNNFERAK